MGSRSTARLSWHLAIAALVAVSGFAPRAAAQSAENVAVVINDASPASKQIGEYYIKARGIPLTNVIHLQTSTDDAISPVAFATSIQAPIAAQLNRNGLLDRVLYIVLTKGVPLRVLGTGGPDGTVASVDSELTLLYRRLTGRPALTRGKIDNPYFLGTRPIAEARPFTHRDYDIYLVTRLDAFTVEEAISLVVKSGIASREGRVVLDQRDALVNRLGEDWLNQAAQILNREGLGDRVLLETTPKAAREVSPVLGYFSWGSTDPQNRVRVVKMDFSPGAIAATFVSTDARTFKEPPASWMPTNVDDRSQFFEGSPQSLIGDLIREGATGVAGQVSEPYLESAVRPQVLFPAYLKGFSLVEAFYLAMPHLSWQTIVVGDPLCDPFGGKTLSRADIDDGLDPDTELPILFSKRRVAQAATGLPGAPERAVRAVVRAENLLTRQDRVGARRALEQATQLAPQSPRAHMMLAEVLVLDNQPALAAESYQRIIALQPDNTIALNNLAYDIATRQKKPAEALAMARKASALAPTDPTVLDTVAWIEHLTGNNSEAARLIVVAARGTPNNPEVRLHAAVILAAQGAKAAAESELKEALRLDPDFQKRDEVKALRAQLDSTEK